MNWIIDIFFCIEVAVSLCESPTPTLYRAIDSNLMANSCAIEIVTPNN